MELKTIFKCLLKTLHINHKASYMCLVNKNEKYIFLRKWIYKSTPLIDNYPKLTISTRISWILHNYTDFPKCKHCGKYIERWYTHNIPSTYSYPLYCKQHAHCNNDSIQKIKNTLKTKPVEHWNNALNKRKNTCIQKYGKEFIMQVSEFVDKSTQTFISKYGVKRYSQLPQWKIDIMNTQLERYGEYWYSRTNEYKQRVINTIKERYGLEYSNVFQVPEIHNKINKSSYKKYTYDNQLFDSAPEIAFYIWLKDNNIEFKYHSYSLKYFSEFDNAYHTYIPDFYLTATKQFVEIKGDQFFNEQGIFINPYASSNNELMYKAKYKCMLDNNVKIMRSDEYIQYIEYVNKNYGKNYISSFKHIG